MKLARAWNLIDNEFIKMQKALDENNVFLRKLESPPENSDLHHALICATAMNLQGFYTGAERILLAVARYIDESIPKGES